MIDWHRWLPGLGQDEPEEEESAVTKTLKALGHVPDALGDIGRSAGQSVVGAVQGATQAVQDAYAVPTEQRPSQYSGPSYAQPSLAPGEQSTLERLPAMGQAGIEGAGEMLGDRGAMLAGLKPPQSAMDVIEQAAPAPVRGLQIGREVLRAAGGAALAVAPQTTEPLFTTNEIQTPLGTIPSMTGPTPQQAGRFVGEELADPTNYLSFGAVGKAADAPVGAALGAVGRGMRAAPGVVRRGASDVAGAISDAVSGNAERMAAADARMAAEGSTTAPGMFGALPEPGGTQPSLSAARQALRDAQVAGDAEAIAAARQQLGQAVDAASTGGPSAAGRALETPTETLEFQGRRLAVEATGDPAAPFRLTGPRGDPLTLVPTGADGGRRYFVQTADGQVNAGTVGQLSDGSLLHLPTSGPRAAEANRIWRADLDAQGIGTLAHASAGAPPPAGRSDPLAAVNRVLGQGAISGVTGTTTGLVNQELNPDDPQAFGKGFVAGAAGPVLAQRGARGLARLAGAVEHGGGRGALSTVGGVPEDAARYRPELSREPVLPGMEPPRRAPGDAGPSISDVPNLPGTRLGNVPPSQLREPTLPGMEPPRRAPGDAGPAISDNPNRPRLPTDPVAGQPGIPGIDGFPDAEQALAAAVKAGRPSIWEWLKKAGYTGMLGPTTAVSQTVGGLMQAGLGAERAAVKAIASGRPGSAGRILAAPIKAVPEGLRALFDVLGGGEGPQGVAAAWGHTGSPMADRLSNPIARFAANAMDRSTQVWAQGPDAFFSPMFRAIGEQEAAEKLARQTGRSVDDLLGEARAVRDGKTPVLRADPDVRAVVDAGQAVADDLGFKGDPGKVGRTLQKLAGRNDAVGMLASYLLPFPAMTARSLKATGRLIPGVGELVGRAEGRDAFTRVHDQMLGAVGTAALGYYAANGGVTGSGPADKNQRDEMISQGWQPHSVAVGGYYLPTRYFQQWAPILDAVGEVHDTYAYGKPKDPNVNLLGDAAKRLGNLATDQVGLSQLNDLLNVLDGGLLQSGPGLAARSLTRYIPFGATIRQGTLLADPVARKPVTWRESGEVVPVTSTLQQIAQNLPGARGGVPERQDVLGRPLPNPNRGLASPRPDPLIRAYEERDLPISGPPSTVSGVELTPAQQRRYQQVMGAELQRLAGSAVTGGDWAQKSPQTQQILLETYLSVARTLAEAAVTSEGGETFSEARRKAILDRARGVAP